MKIVHIFYNIEIGGSETMVIDIMNRQIKTEEVSLIIINKNNNEQLLSTINPLVKQYHIGRTNGSRNPIPFIRLNILLHLISPDVVHMHNHHVMPVIIKQKKCNYFFTAHTDGINILQYKKFDTIFAISKYVENDIKRRYTISTKTIYNGVDSSKIKFIKQNNNPSTIKIVQIGRLSIKQKGQDILLKACSSLYNKGYTHISLDFIGDGKDRLSLEKLAKELEIEHITTFRGACSRDYIYSHIHEYQLLVQPSRQEGFGLTIVEGMIAGIPVLTSDIEGPLEIIDNGKYGEYFKVGNIEDCAESIEKIINNYSLYTEKLNDANKFAREHFDINITCENYIKAYRDLAIQ